MHHQDLPLWASWHDIYLTWHFCLPSKTSYLPWHFWPVGGRRIINKHQVTKASLQSAPPSTRAERNLFRPGHGHRLNGLSQSQAFWSLCYCCQPTVCAGGHTSSCASGKVEKNGTVSLPVEWFICTMQFHTLNSLVSSLVQVCSPYHRLSFGLRCKGCGFLNFWIPVISLLFDQHQI